MNGLAHFFDFDPETANRAALIAHVYRLEGMVEALGRVFAEGDAQGRAIAAGLTPSEARVLVLLSDGRARSRETILDALCFDRADDEVPDRKIADVHVSRLRRKLPGMVFETVRGYGYRLAPGSAAAVKAFLSGEVSLTAGPPRPARPPKATRRPKGSVRDRVMARLSSLAGADGVAAFAMEPFASALGLGRSGARAIRELERRGCIVVLAAPPPGQTAGGWRVRMGRAPR